MTLYKKEKILLTIFFPFCHNIFSTWAKFQFKVSFTCIICFPFRIVQNYVFFFLTFSQTSPGFYMSAVWVFEDIMGKREIAQYKQFLLFPHCFLPIWQTFSHFHHNWNCHLQTLSNWKSLEFVIWESVKQSISVILLTASEETLDSDLNHISTGDLIKLPSGDIKEEHLEEIMEISGPGIYTVTPLFVVTHFNSLVWLFLFIHRRFWLPIWAMPPEDS